jgi:hypothetical protein
VLWCVPLPKAAAPAADDRQPGTINVDLPAAEVTLPPWLKITLVLTSIPLAIYLFDRLMLAFERRGWVYWRKRPRGTSSTGSVLLTEFQQLVEPEVRHVREHERQQRAVLDDESEDDR